MKSFRGFVGGWLLVTGLIVGSHFLHAQGTGSSGGNMTPALSYPSNTLWLSVASVSNGWVNLILHGTTPGTNYVLLSKQTLAAPSWSNAGTLTGATNQSWTPVSVPVGAQSSYFFQAQSAAGQTTSTNLWLEIPTNSLTTPGQLTVVIHNTLPDQFYDVLTNSSLAVPGLWNVQQSVFGAAGNSTTVQLPMTGPALFVRARFGVDSTGSGIPDWWWLQYFGSVGGNPFAFDSSGDGLTLWQDYWEGLNPTVFNTPPAPQGLTVNYNSLNGTANVSWLPSPGPVTGYTVEKTDANASTVQDFNVGTNSYQDDISGDSPDPYNDNNYDVSYRVQAHYSSGGVSAWSASVPLQQAILSGAIVPGTNGATYLLISGLPETAAAVRLVYYDYIATEEYNDSSFNTYRDISVSAFTNGAMLLPASWQSSGVDAYGYTNTPDEVQSIDANGNASAASLLRPVEWSRTFYDGRVQMKQNLIFLLRAASESNPFNFNEYDTNHFFASSWWWWNWETKAYCYGYNFTYPANYVYVSPFRDNGDQHFSFYADEPFDDNYRYRNFVFNTADIDSQWGYPTTGAFFNPMGLIDPAYEFVSTRTNAWLATNQTRWLYSEWENDHYLGNDTSITTTDNITFTMASYARNIYGLPYSSALLLYINNDTLLLTTAMLSARGSVSLINPIPNYAPEIYVETAQPQFQTVEYDFWRPADSAAYVQSYQDLIPGMAGFSPTNTSRLMIMPMGVSPQIAGYAKLAVLNGYPGVYAYLGQYFDRAYTEDANGVATTNLTGFLTPYGNFFPTQPGPAALVTMPDVDTGARGTCTVYCVSMQVDKNSDGNMDLSFNGPDATSQASSYRIWVNNWHTVTGSGGNLDYDKENPGYASPNYSQGKITCQRDLENFFRLWICGLPALPLNQGYTATLSMSPSSGNPAINLYASYDTNGSAAYLTDTNAAQQQFTQQYLNGQLMFDYSKKLRTISSSQSYTLPVYSDGRPIFTHFLFEGACTNGSGELQLTISQNDNTIAQTGVWLDLHDIKDFYERVTITNNISGSISNWTSGLEGVQPAASSVLGNDTNLIVFVHGINVGPWDWLDDSDTVFKRLYWAGFKGKFATVKWPCNYLTPPQPFSFDVFNLSEANAYKSSTSLTTYLNQLRSRFPGYRLNLYVHSQGNAVASEAIKNGAPFDTYIITQGAISDGAYDVNATNYPAFINEEVGKKITPEWQPMGYHGVYTNLPGKIVNFYNTNDPVLAVWNIDQIDDKPSGAYSYDGTNCWYTIATKHLVTDFQETRSMVSRSRSLSVGQSGPESAHGVIQSAVDLKAHFGFNNAFPNDHSAQWTWPIQTTGGYYLQILTSINP